MTTEIDDEALVRDAVLAHWPGWETATIAPLPGGLINRTLLLTRGATRAVLQRVSAVFSPRIHENIAAVTARLADAGLATPRLVPTRAGALYVDIEAAGGVWRMLTHVEGVAFDAVEDARQARAAGSLIARFHAALDGLAHEFVGRRANVHDTPAHLARLRDAVAAGGGHRLAREVGELARAIDAGAAALPSLPAMEPRVAHGDLKFSNVLFADHEPPASEIAVCLIDLDTVGPLSLAYELGDAWRSWCNRAGEDAENARLDLDVLRASVEGYRAGWGKPLDGETRRALLLGVEWVSVELAARFAADALAESYFGWDARRFPSRGDHNLVRARGQWSLHEALVASRGERARILDEALGR
ncbi:MAG TPA: phosphotransferase [Polyangia bacterium]|nr:phosphotransferase [Polyangia bacterium]